MGVEVIFVGTGDSVNSGGKANQAIWIRCDLDPKVQLLIDCGPTTLYQFRKLGLDPDALEAVMLTHFHGDHFIGVISLDLSFVIEYQRCRPMIYAGPRGTRKQFEEAYRVCYADFYPTHSFRRDFHEYLPHQEYEVLPGVRVFGIKMNHRKESLGYRIQVGGKVIAITGDTAWTPDLIRLARNADMLIMECELYRKDDSCKSHSSYEEISKHKHELKASRILLTHLGPEIIDRQREVPFEIAEDGMHVFLS